MFHLDLFSGIGGMTMALEGISQAVMYCDKCRYARKVLDANMARGLLPRAPVLEDIADVQPYLQEHPLQFQMITAGFPCTGFSSAGKKERFDNKESALFFALVDICKSTQPDFIFMENTPSITDPVSMDCVSRVFQEIGYSIKHITLPAFAVGLPHNRFRWFAVAHKGLSLEMALPTQFVHAVVPPEPPRTCPDPCPQATSRYQLLKNAVIPSCAALALRHLVMNDCQVKAKKPNLRIKLVQGDKIIYLPLWPTMYGHYILGSRQLKARSSHELISAIMFENPKRPAYVNFAFLEWLMGFPEDYTLVA